MNRPTTSGIDIDSLERDTGFGAGWFVILGTALAFLGAFAFLNLPTTTASSLFAVGMLVLIGALAQLGTPLLAPRWRGFGPLVLSAISYAAAGILAMANPTLATKPLTLMLAFSLISSGTMRIWLSVVMPYLPGWGWVAASGLVTVIAGLLFIASWPVDALWLLGMALAVDLTFQGAMAIAFGIALKWISR